ncbi:murein L,D-transpeptidase family protein [Sediminibacterium sp.]|uniref:L,D-transpeptidase family protein n=1 Tax=Sediminibacterium sp. TaxID=1917865 RepID=UPI002723A778|nr:L,D-transpeptidase family protein [Sediminibacterium sp.]MDO9000368.1 L,D-transpeptidase family protein [Bacteroidota bacterium]MDP3147063.1 L,D-transpeptidase family protein [Bacteroidota bacterium]MDP3567401.1 L,D-transpeptidase family protein [Sediminibacterium sp.]
MTFKKKIINISLLAILISLFSFTANFDNGFKNAQLNNKRVRVAYDNKWVNLQAQLEAKKINKDDFEVYFRIFKLEKEFEVWVKNKSDVKFTLLKTIAICASSGTLGPKRKQGDYQVPEGFYEIATFNPNSSYHLAMKINYPNQSDKLKKTGADAGGDIMIHGNCVTIGCIPLENEPIEEVYVLTTESKNRKNTTQLVIFPCRLTEKNTQYLNKNFSVEKNTFWETLKKPFDYFEKNNELPKITISKTGDYIFNEK